MHKIHCSVMSWRFVRGRLSSPRLRRFASSLPSEASAVVIGGSTMGASVAYNLANRGLTNVVLLELPQPTFQHPTPSPIDHFHWSSQYRQIYSHGVRDCSGMPGFHACGSLFLSRQDEGLEDFHFHASRDWQNSQVLQVLRDNSAVLEKLPTASADFIGALYSSDSGWINATELYNMLIGKGEKLGVVRSQIEQPTDANYDTVSGYWTVTLPDGSTVKALHLVNAAGLRAKDTARLLHNESAKLPVAFVNQPVAVLHGVPDDHPVVSDIDHSFTLQPCGSSNALLTVIDTNRSNVHVYKQLSDIPPGLNETQQHLLEKTAEKLQTESSFGLRGVTLKDTYGYPVSMTPDGFPLLGRLGRTKNYWIAAGEMYESLAASGLGRCLADTIVDGESPIELTMTNANRLYDYSQRTRNFVLDKVQESYCMHFTPRVSGPSRKAGRPTNRVSGIYGAQKQQGAHMTFRCGWEQCNYFGSNDPSRDNYRNIVRRECQQVIENCGIMDLSSYGKLEIRGPDSAALLEHVFCSELPQPTHMNVAHALTPRGRLFSRARIICQTLTGVTRDPTYLLMLRPEQEQRDFVWLEGVIQQMKFNVTLHNVTEYLGCIGIMGPRSRDIVEELTATDLSDDAFPVRSVKLLRLKSVPVIACRDTTVGELGYQFYHGRADSLKVYEALKFVGERYAVRDFGRLAFNVLRIEKGQKFWGHELTVDYDPVEAGICTDLSEVPDREFVGRTALLESLKTPPSRRLVQLALSNNDAHGDEHHYDPIGLERLTLNDEFVGHTTSGCYSNALQSPLAFAYLNTDVSLDSKPLVSLTGRQIQAKILTEPPVHAYHERPDDHQAHS